MSFFYINAFCCHGKVHQRADCKRMARKRKQTTPALWCLCTKCYTATASVIQRHGWEYARDHHAFSYSMAQKHCKDNDTAFKDQVAWPPGQGGLPAVPQGTPQPGNSVQNSPAHAQSPPSSRQRVASPSPVSSAQVHSAML